MKREKYRRIILFLVRLVHKDTIISERSLQANKEQKDSGIPFPEKGGRKRNDVKRDPAATIISIVVDASPRLIALIGLIMLIVGLTRTAPSRQFLSPMSIPLPCITISTLCWENAVMKVT